MQYLLKCQARKEGLSVSPTTTEHQYWEDRSETFDEDTSYIVGADLNNDIKRWLQNQFTRTDTVLELGCGTGTFSEAVAPLVKDLIATDMSEPMLHQARAKLGEHGNVQFQKQDAYKTTFKESTFDAVLTVNLLHIVYEPALILQECSRVVRNGGKVVVADVTSQGTPLLAGIRLGLRYLKRWGRPPASNRNMSLDELVGLTQDAGFLVKDDALIGTRVKAACLTGYKQG
jgi:ubiquinone/menaquinone biosynthesis C-methylase UbiE